MNSLIVIPLLYNEKTTDYQLQTALELIKNNTVVFYNINSQFRLKSLFKKIRYLKDHIVNKQGIYYFSPLNLLPFVRFKLINDINSAIDFFLISLFFYKKKRYLWSFNPHFASLLNFGTKQYKIIYDIVDYFPTNKIGKQNQSIMIKKSNNVFVNSKTLLKLNKGAKKITLVPQGFRIETFQQANTKTSLDFPSKPIIGFVGGINSRLDYPLLYQLASRNPQYQFVLWGPRVIDHPNDKLLNIPSQLLKLKKIKNISWGESSKKNIPWIINKFNICIIPYNTNLEFNLYCYPMKLFEYFYLGKPVISSPIEELMLSKFKELVYIANNVEEWEQQINKLLSQPWPSDKKLKQRKMALDNSWERKVKAICDIVSSNCK